LIVAAVALAGPASAHHSLAGYDGARPLALEGVVAEFRFAQPHPYLTLRVGPAAGAAQLWKLEMDNLRELEAVGMRRDTFRPGDQVRVTGSPARDGEHALYVRRLDRDRDGLRYEQVGSSPSLGLGRP
jgi:hypothetical protein